MDSSLCPKGEMIWVSYYNSNGELKYIITSKNNSRENYFLYSVNCDSIKKLGKSSSPQDLVEKFGVSDNMR